MDLTFLRGAARSVPVTTEALPLVWRPDLTALAKLEVGLMLAFLKRLGNILVVATAVNMK